MGGAAGGKWRQSFRNGVRVSEIASLFSGVRESSSPRNFAAEVQVHDARHHASRPAPFAELERIAPGHRAATNPGVISARRMPGRSTGLPPPCQETSRGRHASERAPGRHASGAVARPPRFTSRRTAATLHEPSRGRHGSSRGPSVRPSARPSGPSPRRRRYRSNSWAIASPLASGASTASRACSSCAM